jgi:hypothetical protein
MNIITTGISHQQLPAVSPAAVPCVDGKNNVVQNCAEEVIMAIAIRTARTLTVAGLFTIACPAALAASAMEPSLWKITTAMEMEGMKMPSSAMRQCFNKSDVADSKSTLPKDDKWEVYDVQMQDNRTNWKMRCKAFEATSGSGSIAYSRTSYTGTVQISMKGDGGKRTQVTQNYAARRIGECAK